jgi:hyaluronan synthase
MSIRQIRHLSEKPSDFFRLPVFIIVSTFFLMPIRLLGFFRMAHASGWGTRSGAYSGGPNEISSDDEIALAQARDAQQLDAQALEAPTRAEQLPDAVGGMTTTTALSTTTALATRAETRAATKTTKTQPKTARAERRRLNPYAAIPYLIGIAILTMEALFLV